jgi:IS5 family transposase
LILLLTEGQVSDYRGAATLLPALPDAEVLIADKGYDSDWFREALIDLEIEPCIPGRANRKAPIPYNADLYNSATASSACSAGSRTGAASPPDTTAAPTPS